MEKVITTQELESLVDGRDFTRLREETMNWPADDIAELMEPLSAEKEAIILRFLPRNQAADVFSYLSERAAGAIAQGHGDRGSSVDPERALGR